MWRVVEVNWRRAVSRSVAAVALLVAICAALVAVLNVRDEEPIPQSAAAFSPSTEDVRRGEYLARAGNCIGCHTARGGFSYAGGLGIRTPFGIIYSTNLTPDPNTGLGTWTAAHFWRAMHNGRSNDGRLLYPAFPYPEFTRITREDSDAIFAFLTSLQPVEQPRRAPQLRFPYNSQAALAVWRALFFDPGAFEPARTKSAEWNRGAYLLRGLGHCVACHGGRNVFGATSEKLELSGGVIPMQDWYAPSLLSSTEAGVGDWAPEDIVDLLKKGVSRGSSVMGPMAEVVFRSTQYFTDEDLRALAVFLKSLPQATPERAGINGHATEDVLARGAELYKRHCADCHGEMGAGSAGAYPALAGNRAVVMDTPINVIRAVLAGGYLPATAGNPRPYGMPPFAHVLNDHEIAAVVSYIRSAWGNSAAPVSQLQVMQHRR
jgi:mono/diheme cytochrome c family protein